MHLPRNWLVVLVPVLALHAGCSDDPRLGVSGTILFQGKPLDQGRIEFHPPDSKGNMSGAVIENGKYQVPQDLGLAPDTYEVRIFSYDTKGAKVDEHAMPGEPPGRGYKERIHRKYNLASTLKAEVQRGKTTFDFSVD